MFALTPLTSTLARKITRRASKQTYLTIHTLVPRARQDDAYRAYAYFRWLDDLLDGDALDPRERYAALNTQSELMERCLEGNPPGDLCLEEWMLVDLTQGALHGDPGLQTYLWDMMAVMAFDVERRGRRISTHELEEYSRRLATAVTEAVYTFVGEACGAPCTPARYLAAEGAHIVHMLRDLYDDLDAGYLNIPCEILPGQGIDPRDLHSLTIRDWVAGQLKTARAYFEAGEGYLSQIANPRCRVAGALYAARFAGVMEAIEREGYRLRRDYSDCKGGRMMLRMAAAAMRAAAMVPPVPYAEFIRPAPMQSSSSGLSGSEFYPHEEPLQRIH